MYAPPPFGLDADHLDEYIELRNITGQSAPLFDPLHATNAWQLAGAVQFTFPTGATMAPWSYLLVVGFDPAHDPVMLDWFRGRYGVAADTPIYGPWVGNLDNAGERVALYMPDKPEVPPSPVAGFVPQVLVEEVHYSPLPPWPAGADSTGNSLQRIASVAFADDPANWQAAAPTAGQLNQGALTVDSDNDGLPDEWELANGLDPQRPQRRQRSARRPRRRWSEQPGRNTSRAPIRMTARTPCASTGFLPATPFACSNSTPIPAAPTRSNEWTRSD